MLAVIQEKLHLAPCPCCKEMAITLYLVKGAWVCCVCQIERES